MAEADESRAYWAASKIIGRECAAENKEFFTCKLDKGDHPALCLAQGRQVTKCVDGVLKQLNESCAEEFRSFQTCLDRHHNQFSSCRKTERALLNCWNAAQEKKES